ncbi:hypothetical protein NIES4071_11530 [Calothrix sp. NIES-4071]|nr:hypothetical protein NIES4071_11530 [Calothrix sp. NIES-4071]BAZ55493.1 hypothetical protein NIES4105_11490 [Calothrix sp. NIES-4105]
MQLLINQLAKQTTTLKVLAATAVASLLTTATLNTTSVREANLSSTREAEQASQVGLILSAAAIVGLGVGALQANKGTHKTGAASGQQYQQDHNILTIDQVNSKLRAQLLTLLHRDIPGINRLLNQAKFKYPNRTNNWYAEKVIYDLTRDRGA